MKVTFSPLRFPKLTLQLQLQLLLQPQPTRRRQNLPQSTRRRQNLLRFTRLLRLRRQSLLRFILQPQNPFVALASVANIMTMFTPLRFLRSPHQLQRLRQSRLRP
jgi:hypothetical protein